jgi:hypothetical protein
VICFASPAAAGPGTGDGTDFPFVSTSYTALPAADIRGANPGAELSTKENQLSAGMWRWGSGDTRFDLGLDYQYTRYRYAEIDGRNRDLHRLQLPLGIRHAGGGWNLSAYLAPGVGTSSNVLKDLFDRGSREDYMVTARVESELGVDDPHGWLIGAAWDRAFGDERLYPVVGFLYRPFDGLNARIAWPDPALSYRWTERQRLRLRLFPAGFQWHVVSDELGDAFDYEVEAWRLECTWSYRFASTFWLDLAFGFEFDRRHRFRDDTGRLIDSGIDDQWLLSAGLRWRDGPIPYTHQIARQP